MTKRKTNDQSIENLNLKKLMSYDPGFLKWIAKQIVNDFNKETLCEWLSKLPCFLDPETSKACFQEIDGAEELYSLMMEIDPLELLHIAKEVKEVINKPRLTLLKRGDSI